MFLGHAMFLAFSLDALAEQIAAWVASLGRTEEFILRLFLAALAGSLVGLEREVRGRVAGFRTNLLVCLGSALVMIVSISIAHTSWQISGDYTIRIDPARIAYGVMTGVGFLGAGTIIQSRGAVRGLTTAAALWCVAAIGLGIGLGLYVVAGLGTVLVVIVLWILDYLDGIIPKKHYRRVVIRRRWCPKCVKETIERLRRLGFGIAGVSFERIQPELTTVDITLTVSFYKMTHFDSLQDLLGADEDLTFIATR